MKLPKVPPSKEYDVAELVRVLLQLHKDQSVALTDIEVECGGPWDFCKVSIFRFSRSGFGYGSKETRDRDWAQQRAAMEELFDLYMPPQVSWRWPEHTYNLYPSEIKLDIQPGTPLPGALYFIKTDN